MNYTAKYNPLKSGPKPFGGESTNSKIGMATVTVEEELVIKNISVCQRADGSIFVNFPQAKNAQGEWKDVVFPISSEGRANILAAITMAVENYTPTPEDA